MINIEEILRQFTSNAQAVRALVQTISDEQAQWKPNPETWSMKEVMEHVYNEERIDFRKHLKEILSDPPQPWGKFRHEEYVSVESCRQALEGFLMEREASIAWLMALESSDWDRASKASFGPAGDELVLRAGDVLVSWVAHDFLHIRQMNELLYAWNEKQASPYSVQYAGGW
jgi:uncharacterized damage-inducible protein DinB